MKQQTRRKVTDALKAMGVLRPEVAEMTDAASYYDQATNNDTYDRLSSNLETVAGRPEAVDLADASFYQEQDRNDEANDLIRRTQLNTTTMDDVRRRVMDDRETEFTRQQLQPKTEIEYETFDPVVDPSSSSSRFSSKEGDGGSINYAPRRTVIKNWNDDTGEIVPMPEVPAGAKIISQKFHDAPGEQTPLSKIMRKRQEIADYNKKNNTNIPLPELPVTKPSFHKIDYGMKGGKYTQTPSGHTGDMTTPEEFNRLIKDTFNNVIYGASKLGAQMAGGTAMREMVTAEQDARGSTPLHDIDTITNAIGKGTEFDPNPDMAGGGKRITQAYLDPQTPAQRMFSWGADAIGLLAGMGLTKALGGRALAKTAEEIMATDLAKPLLQRVWQGTKAAAKQVAINTPEAASKVNIMNDTMRDIVIPTVTGTFALDAEGSRKYLEQEMNINTAGWSSDKVSEAANKIRRHLGYLDLMEGVVNNGDAENLKQMKYASINTMYRYTSLGDTIHKRDVEDIAELLKGATPFNTDKESKHNTAKNILNIMDRTNKVSNASAPKDWMGKIVNGAVGSTLEYMKFVKTMQLGGMTETNVMKNLKNSIASYTQGRLANSMSAAVGKEVQKEFNIQAKRLAFTAGKEFLYYGLTSYATAISSEHKQIALDGGYTYDKIMEKNIPGMTPAKAFMSSYFMEGLRRGTEYLSEGGFVPLQNAGSVLAKQFHKRMFGKVWKQMVVEAGEEQQGDVMGWGAEELIGVPDEFRQNKLRPVSAGNIFSKDAWEDFLGQVAVSGLMAGALGGARGLRGAAGVPLELAKRGAVGLANVGAPPEARIERENKPLGIGAACRQVMDGMMNMGLQKQYLQKMAKEFGIEASDDPIQLRADIATAQLLGDSHYKDGKAVLTPAQKEAIYKVVAISHNVGPVGLVRMFLDATGETIKMPYSEAEMEEMWSDYNHQSRINPFKLTKAEREEVSLKTSMAMKDHPSLVTEQAPVQKKQASEPPIGEPPPIGKMDRNASLYDEGQVSDATTPVDEAQAPVEPPTDAGQLPDAHGGRIIYASPGSGKSTLAKQHPDKYADFDNFYAQALEAFAKKNSTVITEEVTKRIEARGVTASLESIDPQNAGLLAHNILDKAQLETVRQMAMELAQPEIDAGKDLLTGNIVMKHFAEKAYLSATKNDRGYFLYSDRMQNVFKERAIKNQVTVDDIDSYASKDALERQQFEGQLAKLVGANNVTAMGDAHLSDILQAEGERITARPIVEQINKDVAERLSTEPIAGVPTPRIKPTRVDDSLDKVDQDSSFRNMLLRMDDENKKLDPQFIGKTLTDNWDGFSNKEKNNLIKFWMKHKNANYREMRGGVSQSFDLDKSNNRITNPFEDFGDIELSKQVLDAKQALLADKTPEAEVAVMETMVKHLKTVYPTYKIDLSSAQSNFKSKDGERILGKSWTADFKALINKAFGTSQTVGHEATHGITAMFENTALMHDLDRLAKERGYTGDTPVAISARREYIADLVGKEMEQIFKDPSAARAVKNFWNGAKALLNHEDLLRTVANEILFPSWHKMSIRDKMLFGTSKPAWIQTAGMKLATPAHYSDNWSSGYNRKFNKNLEYSVQSVVTDDVHTDEFDDGIFADSQDSEDIAEFTRIFDKTQNLGNALKAAGINSDLDEEGLKREISGDANVAIETLSRMNPDADPNIIRKMVQRFNNYSDNPRFDYTVYNTEKPELLWRDTIFTDNKNHAKSTFTQTPIIDRLGDLRQFLSKYGLDGQFVQLNRVKKEGIGDIGIQDIVGDPDELQRFLLAMTSQGIYPILPAGKNNVVLAVRLKDDMTKPMVDLFKLNKVLAAQLDAATDKNGGGLDPAVRQTLNPLEKWASFNYAFMKHIAPQKADAKDLRKLAKYLNNVISSEKVPTVELMPKLLEQLETQLAKPAYGADNYRKSAIKTLFTPIEIRPEQELAGKKYDKGSEDVSLAEKLFYEEDGTILTESGIFYKKDKDGKIIPGSIGGIAISVQDEADGNDYQSAGASVLYDMLLGGDGDVRFHKRRIVFKNKEATEGEIVKSQTEPALGNVAKAMRRIGVAFVLPNNATKLVDKEKGGWINDNTHVNLEEFVRLGQEGIHGNVHYFKLNFDRMSKAAEAQGKGKVDVSMNAQGWMANTPNAQGKSEQLQTVKDMIGRKSQDTNNLIHEMANDTELLSFMYLYNNSNADADKAPFLKMIADGVNSSQSFLSKLPSVFEEMGGNAFSGVLDNIFNNEGTTKTIGNGMFLKSDNGLNDGATMDAVWNETKNAEDFKKYFDGIKEMIPIKEYGERFSGEKSAKVLKSIEKDLLQREHKVDLKNHKELRHILDENLQRKKAIDLHAAWTGYTKWNGYYVKADGRIQLKKSVDGAIPVVVSRETAKKFGWEIGRKVIAGVYPADSPRNMLSCKVVGVYKALNDAITLPPSIVSTLGKDYDGDKVSVYSHSEGYWNKLVKKETATRQEQIENKVFEAFAKHNYKEIKEDEFNAMWELWDGRIENSRIDATMSANGIEKTFSTEANDFLLNNGYVKPLGYYDWLDEEKQEYNTWLKKGVDWKEAVDFADLDAKYKDKALNGDSKNNDVTSYAFHKEIVQQYLSQKAQATGLIASAKFTVEQFKQIYRDKIRNNAPFAEIELAMSLLLHHAVDAGKEDNYFQYDASFGTIINTAINKMLKPELISKDYKTHQEHMAAWLEPIHEARKVIKDKVKFEADIPAIDGQGKYPTEARLIKLFSINSKHGQVFGNTFLGKMFSGFTSIPDMKMEIAHWKMMEPEIINSVVSSDLFLDAFGNKMFPLGMTTESLDQTAKDERGKPLKVNGKFQNKNAGRIDIYNSKQLEPRELNTLVGEFIQRFRDIASYVLNDAGKLDTVDNVSAEEKAAIFKLVETMAALQMAKLFNGDISNEYKLASIIKNVSDHFQTIAGFNYLEEIADPVLAVFPMVYDNILEECHKFGKSFSFQVTNNANISFIKGSEDQPVPQHVKSVEFVSGVGLQFTMASGAVRPFNKEAFTNGFSKVEALSKRLASAMKYASEQGKEKARLSKQEKAEGLSGMRSPYTEAINIASTNQAAANAEIYGHNGKASIRKELETATNELGYVMSLVLHTAVELKHASLRTGEIFLGWESKLKNVDTTNERSYRTEEGTNEEGQLDYKVYNIHREMRVTGINQLQMANFVNERIAPVLANPDPNVGILGRMAQVMLLGDKWEMIRPVRAIGSGTTGHAYDLLFYSGRDSNPLKKHIANTDFELLQQELGGNKDYSAMDKEEQGMYNDSTLFNVSGVKLASPEVLDSYINAITNSQQVQDYFGIRRQSNDLEDQVPLDLAGEDAQIAAGKLLMTADTIGRKVAYLKGLFKDGEIVEKHKQMLPTLYNEISRSYSALVDQLNTLTGDEDLDIPEYFKKDINRMTEAWGEGLPDEPQYIEYSKGGKDNADLYKVGKIWVAIDRVLKGLYKILDKIGVRKFIISGMRMNRTWYGDPMMTYNAGDRPYWGHGAFMVVQDGAHGPIMTGSDVQKLETYGHKVVNAGEKVKVGIMQLTKHYFKMLTGHVESNQRYFNGIVNNLYNIFEAEELTKDLQSKLNKLIYLSGHSLIMGKDTAGDDAWAFRFITDKGQVDRNAKFIPTSDTAVNLSEIGDFLDEHIPSLVEEFGGNTRLAAKAFYVAMAQQRLWSENMRIMLKDQYDMIYRARHGFKMPDIEERRLDTQMLNLDENLNLIEAGKLKMPLYGQATEKGSQERNMVRLAIASDARLVNTTVDGNQLLTAAMKMAKVQLSATRWIDMEHQLANKTDEEKITILENALVSVYRGDDAKKYEFGNVDKNTGVKNPLHPIWNEIDLEWLQRKGEQFGITDALSMIDDNTSANLSNAYNSATMDYQQTAMRIAQLEHIDPLRANADSQPNLKYALGMWDRWTEGAFHFKNFVTKLDLDKIIKDENVHIQMTLPLDRNGEEKDIKIVGRYKGRDAQGRYIFDTIANKVADRVYIKNGTVYGPTKDLKGNDIHGELGTQAAVYTYVRDQHRNLEKLARKSEMWGNVFNRYSKTWDNAWMFTSQLFSFMKLGFNPFSAFNGNLLPTFAYLYIYTGAKVPKRMSDMFKGVPDAKTAEYQNQVRRIMSAMSSMNWAAALKKVHMGSYNEEQAFKIFQESSEAYYARQGFKSKLTGMKAGAEEAIGGFKKWMTAMQDKGYMQELKNSEVGSLAYHRFMNLAYGMFQMTEMWNRNMVIATTLLSTDSFRRSNQGYKVPTVEVGGKEYKANDIGFNELLTGMKSDIMQLWANNAQMVDDMVNFDYAISARPGYLRGPAAQAMFKFGMYNMSNWQRRAEMFGDLMSTNKASLWSDGEVRYGKLDPRLKKNKMLDQKVAIQVDDIPDQLWMKFVESCYKLNSSLSQSATPEEIKAYELEQIAKNEIIQKVKKYYKEQGILVKDAQFNPLRQGIRMIGMGVAQTLIDMSGFALGILRDPIYEFTMAALDLLLNLSGWQPKDDDDEKTRMLKLKHVNQLTRTLSFSSPFPSGMPMSKFYSLVSQEIQRQVFGIPIVDQARQEVAELLKFSSVQQFVDVIVFASGGFERTFGGSDVIGRMVFQPYNLDYTKRAILKDLEGDRIAAATAKMKGVEVPDTQDRQNAEAHVMYLQAYDQLGKGGTGIWPIDALIPSKDWNKFIDPLQAKKNVMVDLEMMRIGSPETQGKAEKALMTAIVNTLVKKELEDSDNNSAGDLLAHTDVASKKMEELVAWWAKVTEGRGNVFLSKQGN
jgi:hypothetical protein